MVLQKQNFNLSFNGGLQQKVDAFQLQPNNMLKLENARFVKSGAVQKRPGFTALTNQVSDGTNISNCVAGDSFNKELLLFDNTYIYSYLQGAESWINRGVAVSVINSSKQVLHNISAQQSNPDGVYSGGINVFTWEDSRGGVRYSVMDAVTATFAVQDKLIFDYPPNLDQTFLRAKTIVDGSGMIDIFYTDGGSTLLQNQVNPARPTILGPTTRVFTNGIYQNLVYDVAVLNGSVIYAYAAQYGSTPGAINLIINGTTFVIYPFASGQTGVGCINVHVDSLNHIWVSYAIIAASLITTTYTVYTSCYDDLGNNILSPTVVIDTTTDIIENIAAVETIGAGSVYVVCEVDDASIDNYFIVATVQTNGTVTEGQTQLQLGLSSKAFTYGKNQFINVCSQSGLQSTYFTYCINLGCVVGKINAQVGGGYRSNNMLAECSAGIDPGSFLFACGQKGRFQTNNNATFSLIGVSAETINFEHPNSFNAGTFENNYIFVGGFLQSYDGVSVSEQNFHYFIEGATATPVGSDGYMTAGLVQYQFTYEWTDNQSQTQYSAPSLSAQTTVTVVNDDSVTLVIPTLRVTAKTNVVIGIYRTQANEPVFYKVTSIANNSAVDTVTYTDTASDTSIAANMPLYTQSQVANTAPPSCSLITYFQNRVMLGGLEDPNVIWFSQTINDYSEYNSVAPEFSNLFTVGVDAWRGPITALGWMDDKLLIFKDQTIYYMNGDGPTPTGTGAEFPVPTSILSTVGCSNQNSIVVTYNGVFFQSSKGIYQIDRNLDPTYVGAPVEDQNALGITSSALLADTDEVVFMTAEGTIMVYNYYFNLWSTWTNLPSIDSCIWEDALVLFQSNGTVLVQDTTGTVFNDNGNPISLKIQTPWLALANMQGYQSMYRCFMLGTFLGSHLMNVDVCTNYNPAPVQSDVINSNIVSSGNWGGGMNNWGVDGPTWGGAAFVPYQFQVNFNALSVRNQALQLTFYDSPNSTYTAGYTLSALTFEVGVSTDGMRLPLGQKVG